MRVLQINTVYPYGSTGKICKGVIEACKDENIEAFIACSRSDFTYSMDLFEISTWLDHHIHNRLARMTMMTGNWSYLRTRRFLRWVKKQNFDLIHLHNIHANYIHLESLFSFIKKNNIPVVWTMHDCWSFTGYCYYYSMLQCSKWKNCCGACPNKNNDSVTILDNSKKMFLKKKRMFTGVNNMVLVSPSRWLMNEACQSFMGEYPIKVINNGIDLSIFKRSLDNSFRVNHGIAEDDFILLGVAFGWEKRKGLDTFIRLADSLGENYKIVLVGTNDDIDKKIPKRVISIHRTQNQEQLAEIYSAADLLVNPTLEENFPTVNLEALACGTPVLTYDTGGSAEMLDDTCGSVVKKGDIKALEEEIRRIRNERPFAAEACITRSKEFDARICYKKYVDLYKEILNDRAADD